MPNEEQETQGTEPTGSAPDDRRTPQDPAKNPGPPGNPEVEEDAVAKGQEKLDGTLPH